MNFIPYGTQMIDDDDITAVLSVMKSDYLTCGDMVAEFESFLSQIVGAKYAVAVSNGTAALHLACLALGIEKSDEVITTPLTFAASANCILYCGGKPVFADISKGTMLSDISEIEQKITSKTKAIIPVHYGGELCDMDSLSKLAIKYGLKLIQDCAHSLGSEFNYNGKVKKQGEYDGLQTWSFHPVKTITTGEGGAITTNDKKLYDRLIRLRTHGITRNRDLFDSIGGWDYDMLELGFNYRLTDIQCALGISQLKKIKKFAKRRKEIVKKYNEAFEALPVCTQQTPSWSNPVRHLYTIRLHDTQQRREVYDFLNRANIGVNVHYKPVYWLKHYKNMGYEKRICPNAEDAYERMITIPLHPKLTDEDVEYVISKVKEALAF